MKKAKFDAYSGGRLRYVHALLAFGGLYMLVVYVEFPQFFRSSFLFSTDDNSKGLDGLIRESLGEANDLGDQNKPVFKSYYKDTLHGRVDDSQTMNAPLRPQKESFRVWQGTIPKGRSRRPEYGRISGAILEQMNRTKHMSELQRMAKDAWAIGLKTWEEVETVVLQGNQSTGQQGEGMVESCPQSIALTGEEMAKSGHIMLLPCGLALGSSITLIGKPRPAHNEYDPKITRLKDGDISAVVAQFMLELQGLKVVDGEEPL